MAIPHPDWDSGIHCGTAHLSRSPRVSPRSPLEHGEAEPSAWILGAALVVLTLFAFLWIAEEAQAHTPRPVACQLAWHQAPTGTKWRARQLCLAGQATHRAQHARAAAIVVSTRACLNVHGSRMGVGLCNAIATVRPAWATDRAYHELLRRESTWNIRAVNPSSGACGAFQFLPCRWDTLPSALVQTRAGVAYIRDRYGSPSHALRFHDSRGWY